MRLGVLVNFLSHPVVLGFTNAAAIIIGTSQNRQIIRRHRRTRRGTLRAHDPYVGRNFSGLSHPHPGHGSLGYRIVIYFAPYQPANSKCADCRHLDNRRFVAHRIRTKLRRTGRGQHPRRHPAFALPIIDWDIVPHILSATITIALIGYLETISIAKAIATQTRQRIDANQELLAQGLSNIAGSFFQSFPVSGSFVRSTVTLRAGGQTGFASVIAGLVVILLLLFFTQLLYHMPLSTLAAIVIVSVTALIHFKPIASAWKVHKHDGIVAISSFALTLIFAPHLDQGILIGASLSIALYLYRTMKPRVAFLARHPDGAFRDAVEHDLELCDAIATIRFDGSLYFGSAGAFEDAVLERIRDSKIALCDCRCRRRE